jgi:hypothetical protein
VLIFRSPNNAASPVQVIAFVCVLVWLINYHHFLTWRWRGFKKLADPFFVPDPSTIHVDLGPMVSWLESAQDCVAPGQQYLPAADCLRKSVSSP